MSRMFEELDYRPTPLGALSLRWRHEPKLGYDVFEIKLGDEFLMSSHVTVSEIALADLGIAALGEPTAGASFDVAVGGLGLGYTAEAVLKHPSVSSLLVIDLFDEVIEWHRDNLLPIGDVLTRDPRCGLAQGDFFALARSAEGLDAASPRRKFDAILVDIDHAPDRLLDDGAGAFYTPKGLSRLAAHLKPGGVFGLWSDAPPDADFTAVLKMVFAASWAEEITFENPMLGAPFTQGVYLARMPDPN